MDRLREAWLGWAVNVAWLTRLGCSPRARLQLQTCCWPLFSWSASSLPRTTVPTKTSIQHQLLDHKSKVKEADIQSYLSFLATRSPLLWQLPQGLRSLSCMQIELLDSHTILLTSAWFLKTSWAFSFAKTLP